MAAGKAKRKKALAKACRSMSASKRNKMKGLCKWAMGRKKSRKK